MEYLTSLQPGIGGTIKRNFEDFFVEEIPLFPPSGTGEHVFFEVEKCGITTIEATFRIASALGISQQSIGFAGMKDSRAVTRQWMSAWKVPPEKILGLNVPNMKVLQAARHSQKLKGGQLAGNRFRIIVRDIADCSNASRVASEILSTLKERGVPNYFGEQRFGSRGNNHLIGKAISDGDVGNALKLFIGTHSAEAMELFEKGDFDGVLKILPSKLSYERMCLQRLAAGRPPESAIMALPKKLRGLFVSSYYSHLFNKILDKRIDTIDRLFEGDLAVFGFRGGRYFRVENVDASLDARLKSFEISPSGPVPGSRVELASGMPGAIEKEVLSGFDFSVAGRGTRRPLRFPLSDLRIGFKEPEACIEMEFALPMGCYATAVLREVMKNPENKNEEIVGAGPDTSRGTGIAALPAL